MLEKYIEKRVKDKNISKDMLEKALVKFLRETSDNELEFFVNSMTCSGSCNCNCG